MTDRISLGLDIGVASVGFSVLDIDKGKVLELGSRLFNSKIAEENQTRRDMRGSRRLLNRNKQRREDTAKLFERFGLMPNFNKNDYFEEFNDNLNPYELRVKGLMQQLTKKELAQSLYHLVKRRGISYDLKDADVEGDSSGTDYSASLRINNQELKSQTPAQIQLDRLNKLGAVRGKVVVGNDVEQQKVLLNVFPNKAYEKEAKQIIQKQREFYPEILTDQFEKDYCEILTRKRDYFVGPGSPKARTDYGIYKKDGRTLNNLFEELIGHDKIYPEELRASAASYTAQLFNVLNDLNNLRILNYEDEKLTKEDKEKIISELKTSVKTVSMIPLIKKITGCEKEDIKGFRTDSKDKPEISSMKIYRKVHKDFLNQGIDISDWPVDFLNRLSFILTLNTENGEIRKQLNNQLAPDFDFLDADLIQTIINHKDSFEIKTNNKWHRFSVKTMNRLIPEMIERPIEQMTLLNELGLVKKDTKRFKDDKYLPYREIMQDIFNPVAAKSVREALKIVNAVLKKYGHIDYLVVEMPRDKNLKEEKDNIEAFQKENKNKKDQAYQEFVASIGNEKTVKIALSKSRKLQTEIRLWYQQDKIDPYNNQPIHAIDLIENPDKFEIDHIIPQSISFDDSLNNKTLCFASMNQIKAQKTPFEFMNEGHGLNFDTFKTIILKNKKFGKNKRQNYLFSENVSDIETRKRFISRNLVDTRYSSRVVLNSLQEFFKEKDGDTKVTVIRGKFTSNMRKHWHIDKTRDTFHHHAIDASIIASTPFLNIWKKSGSIFPVKVNEESIDIETGEILDDKEFDKNLYEQPYNGFVSEIMNADDRIKFSHQVDKKTNRKVSDATIYSTRSGQLAKDKKPSEYIVAKVKDIYSTDGYKAFDKVYKKDKTKFLLAKYDPRSFERLEKILEQYPDKIDQVQNNGKVKSVAISPFELYRRDHGMVQKYSKKGNGPVIKQLKYLDKKLGSHIDITPKNANNKHVILQSLKPWRTDVYLNHETGEYEIMGIKYSDLKFNSQEGYGIKKGKYLEIKQREKVADDSEFMFSLYRKDRIKVQNTETDESVELLFWSRTMDSQKGYVELKPISRFDNGETIYPIYGHTKGRLLKRLVPKNCKIWKANTDILGNPFYIKKETDSPKNILD
ncbi:type II CRISPR RNA-guided endonuclease Cas9 [Companilactobacillus halodurans]|uniref:CRISPR-associated endonuclease Cas9 n=1 Tax=Companilactobacillus halodurans TaxID=2584183 RepID=A0A5P0ZZF3_9LACO|nr:type II CRISPR RNA-guided endonuclease Cas9 [Companilactobacillus halodurans]MQS75770.1 type II CRISPR RNA-guided endonuclease Cas9 [Companilactobacillus halodurans]MQS98473.1 type II CRISPR RNA-guided endonuclease Cas9 [Companilactobacillus halodurans]